MQVDVGDFLEAGADDRKITPQESRGPHLAEGLEDMRKGRTHGPYADAGAAIVALDARAKRHVKRPKQ